MKLPRISISYGYRLLLVFALVAAVVTGYFVYANLWRTTVVLKLPYDRAEIRLLSALSISKDQFIRAKHAQSEVSAELQKSLTMRIHNHDLMHYTPGKRIHFTGDHYYNIFGSGHEWIEFELVAKDEMSSTVTVDYFENAYLFDLIPVSWRPGRKEERHIIATIFGEEQEP
jgi:hypothetical protein